ncbi:phosphatidate cytidylyltransferase [Candidatus Macondimonas diazotrophica]|jgi:phosphatidate cytidylyltransferase|uniref:Phosphatidate cytidylyltransferase n=1 Tax=Candidatus Macondimonas diazotrophica TaxID=2305248 RepID=A0A4Z0FBB3_9GAMM|nr:phosphatidate cytidylyltransferase [Candidatus Macondimonas diazotrophica]NCU00917.1 phosphatidate cytidylyltransferase [Candidatus Macondimonas diazotrophica]TFZ83255.1 phosphatidate cytidylyltransferase [Candidatus Macondimonas diazotrophica]HBG52084.1 phosphatidate cytidylyltransferase [Gammaproteobacteria bacterium]HCO44259.1 phosphatidate cytidylyltransferase [Gammaproteobacteria bacterium]
MPSDRIRTALWVVPPIVAAVLLLPNPWVAVLFAAIVWGAGQEWTALMGLPHDGGRAAGVVLLPLMAATYVWGDLDAVGVLLGVALFWWVLATIWVVCFPVGLPGGASLRGRKLLVGLLLLLPAWLALITLHGSAEGPRWVLLLLVMIWLADAGAYYAGRRFGRRKLAPQVSPGKTWAGFWGGLAAGLAAGLLGPLLLRLEMPALGAYALTCLVTVAGSVVGDLTVSMFKRQMGVKDTGHLLPGHGGILDRIDSLTAAAPIFTWGLGRAQGWL